MPLVKYEGDRVRFFGSDHRLHCIAPLPITGLIELLDYLELLDDAIARCDGSKSFGELYANDADIREVTNGILMLCGLSPSAVSIQFLLVLLFPSDDYPRGLIHRINRLDKPVSGETSESSLDSYRVSLATGLVNVGLAPDLDKAIDIVDSQPLPLVEGAIAFRVDSMKDPKDKSKDDLMAKAKEAAVNSSFNDLMSGFGPLPIPGQPPLVSQ